jgi:hypothetical protein
MSRSLGPRLTVSDEKLNEFRVLPHFSFLRSVTVSQYSKRGRAHGIAIVLHIY